MSLDRKLAASKKNTLESLCRSVIVANLERYPPEAFGILDELEWESIIRLRHKRTRPQKGKGGLDGTGRMNPAVGDKFLSELEEALPHLSHSLPVDTMVWKDVVAQKFRVGGVSRPKGLLYPWPVLESHAEEAGKALLNLTKVDALDEERKKSGLKSITLICELPMDVELLKSSGIGKAVKKFLKACSTNQSLQVFDSPISSQNMKETPMTKLESTLQSWMAMAEKGGVKMKDSTGGEMASLQSCDADLRLAKKCNSWRELFITLKDYDEKRRSNQGARMRERKQRLDSVRPKIVKVRHASSRQDAMLNRQGFGGGAPEAGNSKINQLRVEAKVTSSRRGLPIKSTPSSKRPESARKPGGFGAAVAFAACHSGTKRKAGSTKSVQLAGGKRMKVPDNKKASANMKQRLKLSKRGNRR